MTRTLVLPVVAAACLAVLAAGCGGSGGGGGRSSPSAHMPVNSNLAPDVAVRNAVEMRANLSSLTGNGVMRIVDQPSRFGLTVNANVAAEEQGRLRIRADKLAGSIQAFDVAMIGDDIGFYIPTQKTLYSGKVGELQNFSFNFDPDEVLRQLLRPETSLLMRHWRYGQPVRGDPQDSIVLDEDVPAGRPRLRMAVDRRTGALAMVAQLDAAGEPLMVKTFSDYRSLSRGRNTPKGAGAPIFPYRIAFSWPRERRSMEMHFKAVEGNAVVTDADFDLATSSDVRYLPLRDARMESDEAMAGAPPKQSAGRRSM